MYETIALGLWNLAILLMMALIGYVAYNYFPLKIIRERKAPITYRHEFLILFFFIFAIYSLLYIPAAIDTHASDCILAENYTTKVISAQTENTTHYYDEFCFTTEYDTYSSLNVYYSNFRWFFWTYFGVYIVAMVFIYLKNTTIQRREE